MKTWQFALLIVVIAVLAAAVTERIDRRLQAIQEILEEQWTIMDSDAYGEIDRYEDVPEEELFEPEEF